MTMAEAICLRLLICLLVVLMALSCVAIESREKRQGPQGCSIGQLIWPLDERDKLFQAGTFLLPDEVSCNGTLGSVHACFFYNDGGNMNNSDFRLRVGIFRQVDLNYQLIESDDIRITRENSNETQNCIGLNLGSRFPVLEGDKLAVRVRNGCRVGICPLIPILRTSSSVSVFFIQQSMPTITAEQIMDPENYVNVYLDVSASIVPTTSQSLLQSTSPSLSYVTPNLPSLPTVGFTDMRLAISPGHLLHTAVLTTSQLLVQSTSASLRDVTPSPLQTLPTAIRDQQPVLSAGGIAGMGITAVTVALLFLIIVSLIICLLRVRTKRAISDDQTILSSKLNVDVQSSAYHLIPQSSVKTFDTTNPKRTPATQTGAFGIVYKAHYSRHEGSTVETVAVKSLKAIFTSGDLQNLVKEIQLMQCFDHPNVMPLLGVCLNAGCLEAESAPCLVMPYMANGSLLTYLRKAKKALVLPKDAISKQVEHVQKELIKMCYEIALGMNYLAEKKFVHRDLSARNCMMGNDGTIKVADFGLSEDIYTKNYFRVDTSVPIAVPFRWMPLESLEEGIYNEKTDMWSFGITCWEIFTGGKIPYTAMSVREILQLLNRGGRLDKPENAACSGDMYRMMLDCWDDDPEKRPHFLQVSTTLSNMLQTVSGYLDLNQVQSLPPLLPPANPTDPNSPMKEASPCPYSPYEI